MISKYVDHLPLYRQEQMSERWGAVIYRRTMCNWIEIAAMWLEPIYWHMHRALVAGNYIQPLNASRKDAGLEGPSGSKGEISVGSLRGSGRGELSMR